MAYDHLENRWVFTQFQISVTPYMQCFAVSQTSDPTGVFYRSSFNFSYLPDYGKIGIWPDGYYMSFNFFAGLTGGFVGAGLCAFNKFQVSVVQ